MELREKVSLAGGRGACSQDDDQETEGKRSLGPGHRSPACWSSSLNSFRTSTDAPISFLSHGEALQC